MYLVKEQSTPLLKRLILGWNWLSSETRKYWSILLINELICFVPLVICFSKLEIYHHTRNNQHDIVWVTYLNISLFQKIANFNQESIFLIMVLTVLHGTSIKQTELSSWWFLNLKNRVKQFCLIMLTKSSVMHVLIWKIFILCKLQMENSHCTTPLFHEDLVHWWYFLLMNESIVNDSGASLYGASVSSVLGFYLLLYIFCAFKYSS
jgi:hypothetical protein